MPIRNRSESRLRDMVDEHCRRLREEADGIPAVIGKMHGRIDSIFDELSSIELEVAKARGQMRDTVFFVFFLCVLTVFAVNAIPEAVRWLRGTSQPNASFSATGPKEAPERTAF